MPISSYDPGRNPNPDITNDYRSDIDAIVDNSGRVGVQNTVYGRTADPYGGLGEDGWRTNVTTVLGFLDVVKEMVGYELDEYSRLVDKLDSWNAAMQYLFAAANNDNKISDFGSKLDSTSLVFGDRDGVTLRDILTEMGFEITDKNEVKYTLTSGTTTTLINDSGKLDDDKIRSAMGAQIDYLAGQMQTQSVRVNSLTSKSGDAAGNLASLLDELYQMVANYVNKMTV